MMPPPDRSPPRELLEIEARLAAIALVAEQVHHAYARAEHAISRQRRAKSPIERAELGAEAFAAIADLHRLADLAEHAGREAIACRARREAKLAQLHDRDVRRLGAAAAAKRWNTQEAA
jgi:hypothetical protein